MTLLRQRMTEDMQVRSLSPCTQATYVRQVSLFARHFNCSSELLGSEDIRSYQVYLTNQRKLAPSSISIAISVLRFLYKITLRKDWYLEEVIPTTKTPQKLPMVLSPEEVVQFLGCVRRIKHRTILTLWYAARPGRSSSRPNRRAHARGLGEPKLSGKSGDAVTVCLLGGYVDVTYEDKKWQSVSIGRVEAVR